MSVSRNVTVSMSIAALWHAIGKKMQRIVATWRRDATQSAPMPVCRGRGQLTNR
jgi:hypothetical protein